MEMPRPIKNLISQAKMNSQAGKRRYVELIANIITPNETIPLLFPTGMATVALFGAAHSDDIRISGNLQPGVYQNKILPNKDNLVMEVIEREGFRQVVRKYACIPLEDYNPEMQGGHSGLADLSSKDDMNMVTTEFQLLEQGYNLIKNEMVSDVYMMTTLSELLHNLLTKSGKTLQLQDTDRFRGVDIEAPIDNTQVFKQVIIRQGVKVVELANYLQYEDAYGIYSRGIGSYYRKGMWYIYPLFRMGRYEAAKEVLDIFRIPEDVMPTLEYSYYHNERTTTILSTGGANHTSGVDIRRQNEGVGKRVVSGDSIMTETGYHYGAGRALTTRQDAMSEYQTGERASGNEIVPFHSEPTNNVYRVLSVNAFNDGEVITLSWHNADDTRVKPGMACKYFYMSGSDTLTVKEGVVVGLRTEWVKADEAINKKFRQVCSIEIFIGN